MPAAALIALLASVRLGAGAAPSLPTGDGEVTRFAAGAIVGVGVSYRERAEMGLELRRFHLDGLSRAWTSVALRHEREARSWFWAASVGAGAFTGCVADGACNALGVSMGAELGLRLRFAGRWSFDLAFAPSAQVGMPRGAGVLLLPAIVGALGLR